MYRGTTPTLQIACDLDLDTCQTVWLTLQQGCCEITKQRADMTPTDDGFAVTLTQAETLQLQAGASVYVQLRALTNSGAALASNIVSVPVSAILKDGEIA